MSFSLSSSNSPNNTTEVNSQILQNIQSLQESEKKLLNELTTNTKLTNSQQQELITKITDISNLRVNLYSTLHGINYNFSSDVKMTQDTISDQLATIQIVERELMDAQKKLGILEEEKQEKVRLLEINDYYGEKFGEQKKFMYILIIFLVIILILVVLYTREIIGSFLFNMCFLLVGIVGIYYLGRIGLNMWRRSKMDYQKYDFQFNPDKSFGGSPSSLSDPWANELTGTCFGPACCSEQQTYDPSVKRCVSIATHPNLPVLNYVTNSKTT
jgi:uncharacterized membrane protein